MKDAKLQGTNLKEIPMFFKLEYIFQLCYLSHYSLPICSPQIRHQLHSHTFRFVSV